MCEYHIPSSDHDVCNISWAHSSPSSLNAEAFHKAQRQCERANLVRTLDKWRTSLLTYAHYNFCRSYTITGRNWIWREKEERRKCRWQGLKPLIPESLLTSTWTASTFKVPFSPLSSPLSLSLWVCNCIFQWGLLLC